MTEPELEGKKLRWLGMQQHLCVDCCFHLATRIGKVLISTVGCYHQPGHKSKTDEIGLGRKFETAISDGGSWDIVEGYQTAEEAERGHMRFVKKHSLPLPKTAKRRKL